MRSRRLFRTVSVAAGICLLAGTVPVYRTWVEYRTESFKAECKSAASAKDWETLGNLAESWSAWDPESGDAWLYSAQAAQETGRLRAAVDFVDRVPDGDPRCVGALLQRVELLFRDLNEPREAAETCQRILRIDPRNHVAHQRLIFLSAMTLQRRDMVRQIRRAIELRAEPPEAYVYLVGADWLHFSNGYSANSHWLEGTPGDEAYEVARAYHLATAGEKAAVDGPLSGSALMARCRERFPKNPEVLAYGIDRAIAEDSPDIVASLLEKSPPAVAGDSRFWRYRGWLAGVQDDVVESKRAYERALELNPFDWRARHELAGVLRRMGQAEDSARLAELAATGKALSVDLAELPNAAAVTPEILERIRAYSTAVGDEVVAAGLRFRLPPESRSLQIPMGPRAG